ncbi:MAG: hypothetical protein CM15mV88_460 [Caudoviricetes sp.]|nr:MAG: hypothetical protein CM15mV88_460 [Caudoviricetes sp.]
MILTKDIKTNRIWCNSGQLKAVFQKRIGAFNVSHSPRIQSPTAWAQAE